MDGGPSRYFCPGDAKILEDDIEVLKVFVNCTLNLIGKKKKRRQTMDRLHERFVLFLHLKDEITGLKAFKAALRFNSHNLMDA